MRVYEIALPVRDNAGKELRGAHVAFQIIVQTQFGGWTKGATAEGSWADEKGRLFQEEMVPYRIAVSSDHPANEPGIMSTLAGIAGSLFPDQKAFFVADLGEARIISNGHRPRQDRARAGAGKTDGAFTAAAADAPAKSSPRQSLLRPFDYHVARRILQAVGADRVRMSQICWALSEALRDYDAGRCDMDRVSHAAFAASLLLG